MRRLFVALILLTLVGCATSPTATVPPKDKELSRASDRARAAFEDGATARAIDLYTRALNRARAMDNATEIANTAYNLALCYIVEGQLDQASASLAEAEAAFERSGSTPPDVLLLEATVAQRQGKLEQAVSLADQVLSASLDENNLFQAILLKGTVACEQADLARARAALAEAEQYHCHQCHPAGRQGTACGKHPPIGKQSRRGRSGLRSCGRLISRSQTLSRHGAHIAARG